MEYKEKFKKGSRLSLIWSFLYKSKLLFAVSMLAASVSAFGDTLTPQIIRIAVDNVIGGKEADLPAWAAGLVERAGGFSFLAKNLWALSLAIIAVALVKVVAQYVFRVSNTRASETFVKNMRDGLFSHIGRLPFDWHMKNRTGDIIQRCTSDIDTMKNFVSEQMTSIFRIVVILVMAAAFMFSMDLRLSLIALAPIPVIVGYSVRFHSKIGEGFEKCDVNEGKLSAMAQENLTGVRVVRAFGKERYECDRFDKQNEYYTGLWVKLAKVMSRYWSVSDVLSGIQIMLVVVFGAVFCVRDMMSPGEYIAFITYNSMLVWPIRQLGRMITEMSKAGVSVGRVQYIMESEVERDRETETEAPMDRDIAFEHVTFSYDGTKNVLEDVSFTVKAGSTLGILGGTGSGKSTLMLLLDRLYDVPEGSGRISVGGVDIKDIKLSHVRKNVGIVLQEPFLFSRSIAENIGITSEVTDAAAIKEAAKAACLDETVESFSKGYETFVGERGVTLSGGQKQRAAIARTLTKKTPVMIFDDSLSAVDTETDAKIRASLEARFGSATIILISHRITTLSKADRIIVLDRGRIVEEGTHDELKDAGGIYSKIYGIQSLSAKEAAL